MKCPYSEVMCACIDTAGMDQVKPCEKCEHYPNPVEKLMNMYPCEQILNYLPKTLIIDRKTIFHAHEIYDMNISRDGLDNWVIDYFNERSVKSLFIVTNEGLHHAAAEMLADLIGNGYINELKNIPALWKVNKEADGFEFITPK